MVWEVGLDSLYVYRTTVFAVTPRSIWMHGIPVHFIWGELSPLYYHNLKVNEYIVVIESSVTVDMLKNGDMLVKDSFRNLNIVFLKLCMKKEIAECSSNHGVFDVFFTDF